MTWRIALWLVALLAPASGEAGSIEGKWRYYKKIYQGIEMPEGPKATLRLYFIFLGNGESRLFWWHEGENDLCFRKGRYFLEGDLLVEEVVWVDPRNAYGCDRDPDMQLGRKTRTPYFFSGKDLAIRFHLGNEPLVMVWKREEI